jgi:cytidine deaminase
LSELDQTELNLLEQAKSAAQNYFNKRSSRRVGAALLCKDGSIYLGASIRRTNVSNSTCAERMALDKAIFDQKYEYTALAIIGYQDDSKPDEMIAPCGLCRQILAEAEYNGTTSQAFSVILASSNLSNIIKTDTKELFPIPYHGKEK